MAILSRPSLRGPVRRNPDSRSESHGRPPMKKQRTLEDYGVRRRRSSPDCLDTTATQDMNAVDKPRSNPPLKPARPRSATKRARRHSSSSVDSIASATQLKTPNHSHINGNGSARNVRVPDRNTPSALQRLLDDRDSPDPLDTISPAPTTPISRPRSLASTNASESENKPSTSTATTNTTQKDDSDPTPEPSDVVKDEKSGEEGRKAEQPTVTSPAAATRSQQKRKSEIVESEQPAPAPAPAPTPTGTERRSLRSADTGSRCKSDLAQYFYNYEQIISLQNPKPVETLAANTSITIVDDLSETLPFPKPDPNPFGNPLEKLYDCEPISLPKVTRHSSGHDPLSEELYFKSHRRFERQEKQLRNIERDRAQHEKQQLDRLLEELRGQDWLRVMGLIGVHENEKKLYEPKRDILIQELVALLKKFQAWKDEEKRRKLAKEKTTPAVDAETESRRSRKRSRPAEEITEESSLSPELATPSTPDPSDVDALAARQLHQEARSASDSAAKSRRKSISGPRKPKPKPTGADEDEQTKTTDKKASQKRQKTQDIPEPSPIPPDPVPFLLPPLDDKPFTSFFSDPHERETALSAINTNREERTHIILAFGQPLGEVEEREFQPPDEFITEEAIQSSRRQRRLLKRRSHG